MHLKTVVSTVVLAALFGLGTVSGGGTPTSSGDSKGPPPEPGQLIRISEREADWAARQRAQYPLDECLVSGEPLGSMGRPAEYIYRIVDRDDRLVRFCCGGCRSEFLADPEAALAKLTGKPSGPESRGEAKRQEG